MVLVFVTTETFAISIDERQQRLGDAALLQAFVFGMCRDVLYVVHDFICQTFTILYCLKKMFRRRVFSTIRPLLIEKA